MRSEILKKIVPEKLKRIARQLINFKILSVDYAQYKTILNWECVDRKGDEIGWYTYPAIEYLNNLDFSQKSIFEYGSGNSSIFWAKKSKNVISIEHDEKWFNKVKSNLRENQTLLLKTNEGYENSISEENKNFDVVVIDGIRRVECSKVIQGRLNKDSDEGFMIILDNSERYKDTSRYLREEFGLIEVDFHGFGPINGYTWTTSIFLSRNFNFKPNNGIQPHFPISGIIGYGE
jgi:hypothetical protein